jgi:hypothetical protein
VGAAHETHRIVSSLPLPDATWQLHSIQIGADHGNFGYGAYTLTVFYGLQDDAVELEHIPGAEFESNAAILFNLISNLQAVTFSINDSAEFNAADYYYRWSISRESSDTGGGAITSFRGTGIGQQEEIALIANSVHDFGSPDVTDQSRPDFTNIFATLEEFGVTFDGIAPYAGGGMIANEAQNVYYHGQLVRHFADVGIGWWIASAARGGSIDVHVLRNERGDITGVEVMAVTSETNPVDRFERIIFTPGDLDILYGKSYHNLTRQGSLQVTATDILNFQLATNSTEIRVTIPRGGYSGTFFLYDVESTDNPIQQFTLDNNNRTMAFSNLTSAKNYFIVAAGIDGAVTITLSE